MFLKDFCFPAQLDWTTHVSCSLTSQPSNRLLAPPWVCLTPNSFFVSLTLVTHSLSWVPPPPGNLPVLAGWFRWLSSVLLPHLDESIENVLFHLAFVSIFISLNLSVAWRPPEVSSLGFHVLTLFYFSSSVFSHWDAIFLEAVLLLSFYMLVVFRVPRSSFQTLLTSQGWFHSWQHIVIIHTPVSFLWCFDGSQVIPPLNTFLPTCPLSPLEDWELPEQGAISVFPDTGVYWACNSYQPYSFS